MKQRTINIIIVTVVLLTLAFNIKDFILKEKQPIIGYVRSQDLISSYHGMQEAQKSFMGKMNAWKLELDSLELRYNSLLSQYSGINNKLEASKIESSIIIERERLERRISEIENIAQEEEAKLMQGVLNQVNTFIGEYSERNGYDIVFGVTGSGNIVYGGKALDITDKVLFELNNSYKAN